MEITAVLGKYTYVSWLPLWYSTSACAMATSSSCGANLANSAGDSNASRPFCFGSAYSVDINYLIKKQLSHAGCHRGADRSVWLRTEGAPRARNFSRIFVRKPTEAFFAGRQDLSLADRYGGRRRKPLLGGIFTVQCVGWKPYDSGHRLSASNSDVA